MAVIVTKKEAEVAGIYGRVPKRARALLSRSVSELTPPIETAGFDEFIEQLHDELKNKNLNHLKIETYFGDEWFCPSGTTAIAIPFWLADDRLKTIELKIMGFVEGGSDDEFMRLLRHEAGHCVDHAYRLSRRDDWREIFGNPNLKYDPDSVQTISFHPDYVANLPGGYAQTHPEEDFAETFAVWLDPDSGWRQRYRKFPVALEKLEFVDDLMSEIGFERPKRVSKAKICNARRMRRSLASYYLRRVKTGLPI
jgi:hypothetical protein